MLSAEVLPKLHICEQRQYYHKVRSSHIDSHEDWARYQQAPSNHRNGYRNTQRSKRMNGVSANHVPDRFEHIWIVTGPAGCGKTTVAQFLAQNLDFPYVEGDDVWAPLSRTQSPANSLPSSTQTRIAKRWRRTFLSQTPSDGTGS